jgi:hypothetical protein
MPGKRNKIPVFRNDREEREFWARHSVEEFADGMADLDVEIGPPRTWKIAVMTWNTDGKCTVYRRTRLRQ